MEYYNDKYYNWQKQVGAIGGYLNRFKFESYIKDNDAIMDFGCGGGFLLGTFQNKKKFGFEINKSAWNDISENGGKPVDSFDDISNNSIDVIISNHALEHVPLPLEILKNLHSKLKPNGTLCIVIPCEQPSEKSFYYRPNDINQHLHTWCPMTFGNLATLAGFTVNSCKPIQHQWCPDYIKSYRDPDFHSRCIEHAKKNGNIQVKLVATK